MFPQHVIARKRDGHALTGDEIADFVRGATDGSWADYQLSAMLMAIFLRGMTLEETADLAAAMVRSGKVADLSRVKLPTGDKHSTGGVGDKVSLHLAPMLAACGVAVPMISGRGLGHTGGTLDKLESIPGFRVNFSLEEYHDQIAGIGLCLIGQTAELAPADRKLYALRDVTGTVECLPLICASILSKKLAEGAGALVMDVKFGRGAFMKEEAKARDLARALVDVATRMGTPTRAVMTAMDQPLGRAVGNAVEVVESIECLNGRGPADTMEVTFALGAHLLILTRVAATIEDAKKRLERAVASGAALARFKELITAQGGDVRVVDDPALLPRSRLQSPLAASRAGYVHDVDAMEVALATLRLGAGRTRTDAKIDPAVGITALVKVGEQIERGAPLCVIHAASDSDLAEAKVALGRAIQLGDEPKTPPKLIGDVIA